MQTQTQQTPQFDPEDIRFFITGFLLSQESRGHSPRTYEFHQRTLEKFVWWLQFAGQPTKLRAITPTAIRLFMKYLQTPTETGRWGLDESRTKKPLKPASVHSFGRSLRAFFTWATEEADLPKNPFPKDALPKLPGTWQVEVYTDEEIARLFAVLDESPNAFLVARNRALLSLLLDTGLRATEALSVTYAQASGGSFHIIGKGGKERAVIVGNTARKEIWDYLMHHRLKMKTKHPELFVTEEGTPLTYWGLKEVFRTLREKSGITRINVKAHNCRHTFATKAHQNGMRGSMLQQLLGHAQFDTTVRYYLHITEKDLKAEHDQYGPLDNMKLKRPARKLKQPSEKLPSPQKLLEEVQASNFSAVARKYGVSDTLIHRRLRDAGIHP